MRVHTCAAKKPGQVLPAAEPAALAAADCSRFLWAPKLLAWAMAACSQICVVTADFSHEAVKSSHHFSFEITSKFVRFGVPKYLLLLINFYFLISESRC